MTAGVLLPGFVGPAIRAFDIRPGVDTVHARPCDGKPGTPPGGAPLVIVGTERHHHAWVSELVDLARERDASSLVIDMGWSSHDRHYSHLATFGASRNVGQARVASLPRSSSETKEKQ